jgi:hypothetical protein
MKSKARKPSKAATPSSPWLTSSDAGRYLQRGRRFIIREIRAGRMRGATIGGRREVFTRTEWCDQWVLDHATPIELAARRRA